MQVMSTFKELCESIAIELQAIQQNDVESPTLFRQLIERQQIDMNYFSTVNDVIKIRVHGQEQWTIKKRQLAAMQLRFVLFEISETQDRIDDDDQDTCQAMWNAQQNLIRLELTINDFIKSLNC